MDILITIGLLVVLAPLLIFALASMGRGKHRGGGGGGFVSVDQVFDPSRRHILEVAEERVLERDKGEPPLH